MALAALSPVIERFKSQFGLEGSLKVLELAWQNEMGAWGGMVELSALDNGSLVIEARTPSAMQELSLRRKELIRRLNAHFPKPWIRNLSIRLAHHGNGR